MLTLDEAKKYLRIDTDDEDELIESFILSAEAVCMDVARLSEEEWDAVTSYTEGSSDLPVIRGETVSGRKVIHAQRLLRAGVFYALSYLEEYRENADFNKLTLTLRGIVGSIREGVI